MKGFLKARPITERQMETTILVVAGKTLQVAFSVGLTLLVVLVIQVGDGLLAGRASSFQTEQTFGWDSSEDPTCSRL
jgi:hypothetical protein